MKKRFWALFLAVMMVVSVLPTTAFADADDEPVRVTSVSTPDSSPVKITKSVNDAGDRLTMEAYVTGQVVTTNPEPLDIVLVLDVSGSMKDDISIVKEENVTYSPVADREPIRFFLFKFDTNTNSYVCSDWENGGEYWYSEDGETFYPVTKIERIERKESGDSPFGLGDTTYVHYEYTYTVDGENRVYATEIKSGTILGNDADNEVVQRIYYKTVETKIQTVSKMKALQDAVKKFISATAEKNQNVDAASQHRISIVKFAGDKTDKIGNDTYESGRYEYNNSQIVMELTVVDEAGAKTLSDTVNELQAAGATAADWGMEFAKKALKDSDRKQVVIFFTDGEPNHGNGFNESVANATVNTAKELKAGGATIYTIGVFAGADPTDSTKKANQFMHAVSSNYPKAGEYDDVDSPLNNDGYYQTATTQGDLTRIFGAIAEDMIPDVTAGSTSVLTDTVSDWFTAPADPDAVSVEVWSAGGTGETATWMNDDSASGITVSVEKGKISVTGFDYSANAVVKKDGSWTGKKLVISFAIAPNAAANWTAGTNLYPTNVAGKNEVNNAGLSYGNEKTELTESPTVPVTAYSVTYSYSGETPSGAPAVPAAKAYLPGTEVSVAAAPEFDGYNFDGWYKDENKATGVITVDSNITLTGSWSENPPATTYTLTYHNTADGPATANIPEAVTGIALSGSVDLDVATTTETAKDGIPGTWSFDGWYPDEGLNGTPVTSVSDITANVDVYAKWTFTPYTYTFTFDANGGAWEGAVSGYTMNADMTTASKDSYNFGAVVEKIGTEPVREGYEFLGWYTYSKPEEAGAEPELTAKWWGNEGSGSEHNEYIYENTTVYAKWVEKEEPPKPEDDKTGTLYINLQDENGAVLADLITISITKDWLVADTAAEGVDYVIPATLTVGEDKYIFEKVVTGELSGTLTKKNENVFISLQYTLDNWNDEDDELTGGDGIPDKYQAKVTYQVVNGTWSDDTTAAQVKIFTLYQKNLTDNTWQPITPAVTLGDTIPTGMKPAVGYTDEGAWNEKITAETPVTKDATYTYTFTAKVPEPGLSVTKTVNKTSVTVGDKIIYTITVKNTGNVDLTNVNVVEAFGGDFSKIFDLTGATKASTFNGFVIGELKAGETKEITFSYKTTTRGTLTNSVKVTGTYEPGKTVEDRAASSDVTVKSEPITPVGPSKPQLNYEDHYAYVVGYPDGLVHPERNITRAEVATIFFRMLLDESREYFWAQENDFSDVAETDWFNNAVSTLANAQLINGYPDGSYRPNANITRAEFATIAIRFFLDEDVEIEENNLSDVKGHWAEANINLAYALELINGYPDGTFRPDQKITRAEAMAIVNRVLKRAPEKDHLLKDMIEWPDNLNTAAWYYADVQEATNSHKFHMDKEEEYEIWTELLPVRDWVALEQEWSKANSSKNPGEVVDIKITTPEAGDNGLKLD